MGRLLSLLTVSMLALTAATQAEDTTPAARIAAAVQKEIDAKLFPGAVVVIGTPEKVLYHEAFGYARVEPDKVPMQKDSIFDVMSVTKAVGASTAIAICKDRGLVDPDEMLTKYIPDHKGKGVEKISLRRLASHTSGFTEQPAVSRSGRLKGEKLFAEMLKDNPKHEVNTHYEYADRNIILLSTIVERVSGKTFEDFCAEEIFKPLQMNDSCFNKIEVTPRVVATNRPDLSITGNVEASSAGRGVGHAGLFTSAVDLSHFCEMMLNNGAWGGKQIIKPETVADFTKRNQLPQFLQHGFVWRLEKDLHERPTLLSDNAYGHSGDSGISVWMDPKLKVYTIIMTNRNHPAKTEEPRTGTGKEPKNTPRGIQQHKARSRMADAMLTAFGYARTEK